MNTRIDPSLPFVSCILPTADRVGQALEAIHCFDRQTYPVREMVVVDDGADPGLGAALAGRSDVTYLREERRRSVGAKRNLACEAARGEVVVHWDDDDWSAPSRISRLIEGLAGAPGGLIGQEELYFYRPADRRAWLFVCPAFNRGRWLAGATLAYRKEVWRRHPFRHIDNGEDWLFVKSVAAAEGPYAVLADPSLYVATVHPRNTAFKDVAAPFYRPRPSAEVERLLGDRLDAFRALTGAGVGEAA